MWLLLDTNSKLLLGVKINAPPDLTLSDFDGL